MIESFVVASTGEQRFQAVLNIESKGLYRVEVENGGSGDPLNDLLVNAVDVQGDGSPYTEFSTDPLYVRGNETELTNGEWA